MKDPQPIAAEVWAGGRSVGDPRLSPDGLTVAFVAGYADGAQLVLAAVEGGAETWLPCRPAVRRVSSSGGGVFVWLPSGQAISYVGIDGRVYLLDLETYRCRAISRTSESVSTLTVSPKGDEVAYVLDTQHLVVASLVVDGAWPRRVSSGADFVMDAVWSPDGEWLAWHEWDDPHMPWNSSRIVVRRADCSGPVATVAGGGDVCVQQPRFSPDGRYLAYMSDASGWLNLWSVDARTFENARPLLSESIEHAAPTWGPGQRTYCWTNANAIAVSRNVEGRGDLVELNIAAGTTEHLGSQAFAGLDSVAGRIVGVRADFAMSPEIAIPQDDDDVVVARGATAGVEQAGVEPEGVEWRSADGTVVPGRLYRTQGPGPTAPMLVWIHGGPTGQSPATLYARIGYFVERGWSVLVPDYRGSSGWGRQFMRALDGQWGIADVQDVAAGVQAAARNGWCDPSKVVAYGGSAGGFTTLLLMEQHPDLFAAGVAMYPVADLLDFGESTWRFEAHYLETLVGQLPQAYETYKERSPLTHASKIKAPLLMLHGDEDVVVPVAQSNAMAEAIRRSGGSVDYHVYSGEGHSWRKPATLIDELQRVHAFIRRNVLHLSPTTEEST